MKFQKKNNVSIGAHPSFNDPKNFGRKRHNLSKNEIKKLIIDQYEILKSIADNLDTKVTHIKPHGALNNMACEDLNLSKILAETIYDIDKSRWPKNIQKFIQGDILDQKSINLAKNE